MTWTTLRLSPDSTTPYVVSPRMKHAIESLDLSHEATSRARIVVVSDAPSLQAFFKHSLNRAFEVVVAPTVRALVEAEASLFVADLYTLHHQQATDLDLLRDTYDSVPLLIASQESAAAVRKLPATVLDRPHATLPLPTRPADLRRAAAALLGASTSSPSP